jgi:peptidoglycan/LPS O-acetylase OafA/YrhL
MSSEPKVYFNGLDTIRFVAALMVFLGHTISKSYTKLGIEEDSLSHKILSILSSGGTGVTIFFVLSGFLITYLILTEIDHGKFNLKYFYMRRTLRIWPLYYAVVVFSFFLYPGLKILINQNQPLASQVIYHLTFLSNFDVISIYENSRGLEAMSQNITWSVSIEEQFYLFFPLLFFVPRKGWLWSILLVIITSLVFRYYNQSNPAVLYYHTLSVLPDLLIGSLFAYAIKVNQNIHSFFERTTARFHLFLLLLFFTVMLIESYLVIDETFFRLIKVITIGFVVASQALSMNKTWFNFANWKFAERWGKRTYGIYMLHPICITALDVLFRSLGFNYTSNFTIHLLVVIITFIFTLALSEFSYKCFEARFLKYKKLFR